MWDHQMPQHCILGQWIPCNFYLSRPYGHHRIFTLEDNIGDVLAIGCICVCLLNNGFVMFKIGLNDVGVKVINAMVGHGD